MGGLFSCCKRVETTLVEEAHDYPIAHDVYNAIQKIPATIDRLEKIIPEVEAAVKTWESLMGENGQLNTLIKVLDGTKALLDAAERAKAAAEKA